MGSPGCGNSDGWVKIEGQWFLFRDDHQVYGDKSWHEAENYCRVRGANLASVTSEEMFEELKKRMKLGELWIGLQDPHRNGSWMWSDGSPFELEKWFEGEPSDLGKEYCGEMQKRRSKETGWNNRRCGAEVSWICSRKTCREFFLS